MPNPRKGKYAKKKPARPKKMKAIKSMTKPEEEPHSVLLYPYRCTRCAQSFPDIKKLKEHSQRHIEALKEIRMLTEGQMPEASKLGSEFKGKNKVIIS